MSVENWSGSVKDNLIESAVTAASFMIIDKLYYKSPMGIEWKKGGISFVASYLSEFGSDMIAPKLGSSGYMAEKTYLQPVVSGALYVGGEYLFSMQNQGVLYPFLFQIGAQVLGDYLTPPLLKMI
jgi:hypothetical protein